MTERVYISVNKAWASSFVCPHVIKFSLPMTFSHDKFLPGSPSFFVRVWGEPGNEAAPDQTEHDAVLTTQPSQQGLL